MVHMHEDNQLRSAQLYLCTDARQDIRDFERFVNAAYEGGVDIIQLRDKRLEASAELEAFTVLQAAARRHGKLFAANDRADVAALAEVDVLHLGQGDLPLEDARRLLPSHVSLGQSTHSLPQAMTAQQEGADYYCIGPVWPTPTKPGRQPVGLEAVRAVAEQNDGVTPWFAIGDVRLETISRVVDAGARRVVVVRAITEADDPRAAAQRLRAALPVLTS
jgi:thiamine-phosphate pyrophosphorylase